MEKIDLDYFRDRLNKEKMALEEELGGIARVNPKNPQDWEAVPAERDEMAFRDENADRLEELEDREATVIPLEGRLRNILTALERMEANTYDDCTVCHEPIEKERLEANPAATTCKKHLNQPGK